MRCLTFGMTFWAATPGTLRPWHGGKRRGKVEGDARICSSGRSDMFGCWVLMRDV